MAVNLRSKLLDGDTLLINDRSKEAVTGVLEEISAAGKGTAEAASSPREVAERSVSVAHFICLLSLFYVMKFKIFTSVLMI